MDSFQNLDNTSIKRREEESIDLKKTFYRYIYHWPLFIVTIAFSLTAAFLFLRYSKPVYEIQSTLLIKGEKNGMSETDILSQLDVFGGSMVVENEQEILKSKSLMIDVVKTLNLNVRITTKGRVIDSELYEDVPVDFRVYKAGSIFGLKDFSISFPDSNHYELRSSNGKIDVKGDLNKLQNNSIGVYKIDKAKSFRKYEDQPLFIRFEDPVMVANDCLSRLSVSVPSKQSTLLSLNFQSPDPKRGKDILNTLIKVYNEAALADKNRTTQSTSKFIDERLALITGELVEVEKDVEGFKSSQGLTDISSEAALYLENVRTNDAKLNEVNLKLAVVKDIQNYIDSEAINEKIPGTFGIEDPVLLGQITQLGDLQLRKVNLLATTEAKNPIFNPINEQITATKAAIRANLKNIEASLLSGRRGLTSYNLQYESSIKKIPKQERQFISIKRQQTVKESLYLYLLQKKEEAALSYASAVVDTRVIDPAFASPDPVSPKKSITYIVAFAIGILIPVVGIFMKDLMNDQIVQLVDITDITKVPILGEVVLEGTASTVVVTPDSRSLVAEQFRAIRTNLQFLHVKKENGGGNVTLFTSSMSGEGKSFVATNVATALALSGKKTILLEFDLRKPKISMYLGNDNRIGLSNYLIGQVEIDTIIKASNINGNLFLIGSGPIPPNPSELLVKGSVDDLFAYLVKNYDEVIIDSPPIGLVIDAQILTRVADATIYLIRQGLTSKHQVTTLNNLSESEKFPNMSIIFNGVKVDSRYGYGYGYGYGQGYYSENTNTKDQSRGVLLTEIGKRLRI